MTMRGIMRPELDTYFHDPVAEEREQEARREQLLEEFMTHGQIVVNHQWLTLGDLLDERPNSLRARLMGCLDKASRGGDVQEEIVELGREIARRAEAWIAERT